MQPKQMKQQQMQVRQMTQGQFTRPHGMHEHSMTLAQPQRDQRRMQIPSGTFEPLGGSFTMGSLPFRGLRTWLFSLLALLALPLGAMLVYVGMGMQEEPTWNEQTALVDDYSEDGLAFHLDSTRRQDRSEGFFNFRPGDFFSSTADTLSLNLSVCDLFSRFMLPAEEDASFSVWVHPTEPERISCFPVSSESGLFLTLGGAVLIALSVFRLLKTIGAAASKLQGFS
jgi:hypothetical protein